MPEIIQSFHEKYPKVNFDLYTATADHIKERMHQGLTDVGLSLELVNMEKYEFILLEKKEQWVVTTKFIEHMKTELERKQKQMP